MIREKMWAKEEKKGGEKGEAEESNRVEGKRKWEEEKNE